MSTKKRVTFNEKTEKYDDTNKNKYYEKDKEKRNDDDTDADEDDDSYDDENSDVEGTSNKEKKHSIDSDEEEEGRENRYKVLKREVLDEIGQEAKTAEFDENIKLTPFNMKDELEEGDFDTDGYFHWKKNDEDVHDAWLDNIDWNNANTFKKFKKQKYEIDKDEKEENRMDEGLEKSREDDEDENEDEKNDSLVITEKIDQNELFKQILVFLKPNENILSAIKRLGKSNTNKTSASLSASQRWSKKKKQEDVVDMKNADDEQKRKEDAVALDKLTSLANKFIDMGYYDIYEETYEKINFKLNSLAAKKDDNKNNQFDIFADEISEQVLKQKSEKEEPANQTQDVVIKWVYKNSNTDDAKINGPFTSEQMLKMSEDGTFSENGVWCRKENDMDANFYNSRRIDFDLYT